MQTVATDRLAGRTRKAGGQLGKAPRTAGKAAQKATAKPVRKVRQEVKGVEARVVAAWIGAMLERFIEWLVRMAAEAVERLTRWTEGLQAPPATARGRGTPRRSTAHGRPRAASATRSGR